MTKPRQKVARKGRKPGSPAKSANEWQAVFLKALEAGGVVKLACHQAGITRKTAYQHRLDDAAFQELWDLALEDFCDTLEALLLERAKRDDTRAAIFFLKAWRPEVYSERYEHHHSGNVTAEIAEIVVRTRSEAKEALSALAETTRLLGES